MKGIIFDIQRFALHDGHGIRTVVFLKGCPFRCVWCCNPESQLMMPQLGYESSKCVHCMKCVKVCSSRALTNSDGKLDVDFRACTTCGKCVEICPERALKIYGWYADSDDIIAEVLKDQKYFKATGGGLTLSGGDPLHQIDFCYELLSKAKANGLHTTVETEGYYSPEQFAKIFSVLDYLFFDYKITDPSDHVKYTGVEKNIPQIALEYAANSGIALTIRCVIIPGINDNDEHFKAIAEISNKYANLEGVEIMPYHEYGKEKFYTIGRRPYPIDSKTVSKETASKWIKQIKLFGGKNIK